MNDVSAVNSVVASTAEPIQNQPNVTPGVQEVKTAEGVTVKKVRGPYIKRKDALKGMSNEAIANRIKELSTIIKTSNDVEAKRVATNERIGLYAEQRKRVSATISQNATAGNVPVAPVEGSTEVPPVVNQ